LQAHRQAEIDVEAQFTGPVGVNKKERRMEGDSYLLVKITVFDFMPIVMPRRLLPELISRCILQPHSHAVDEEPGRRQNDRVVGCMLDPGAWDFGHGVSRQALKD